MLWIRPLMVRPVEKLLVLLMLAVAAAGCKPKIGDDCRISTDCSAAGDRLCDITAPGGYCTVFGCEPGSCPADESLCVQFGERRSPYCDPGLSPSPYTRTFCMATCDSDDDCRGGYVCADLGGAPERKNAWGALLIDTDRGHKACLVPYSSATVEGATPETGVCDAKNAAGGGSNGSGAGSNGDAAGAGGSDSVGAAGAGG